MNTSPTLVDIAPVLATLVAAAASPCPMAWCPMRQWTSVFWWVILRDCSDFRQGETCHRGRLVDLFAGYRFWQCLASQIRPPQRMGWVAPVNLPVIAERLPIDLWPLAVVIGAGTVWVVRYCVSALQHVRTRTRLRIGEPAPRIAQNSITTSFGATRLDVAAEALGALRQVDDLAARNRVRLQIAVQPSLAVHADPAGFRWALIEVLENAIAHAPCGKVMLGGRSHGGRVQIVVLDDGQTSDRLTQEAALRPVERIVALHGGTLQVEVRPGQGTLVILRLPEPSTAAGNRAAETASQAAASQAAGAQATGSSGPKSAASSQPDLAAAHH